MLAHLYSAKLLVFSVFVAAALYVHFRGRARFPLRRQIGNHATLLAPYNVLMYWFSKVPGHPLLDAAAFPELAVLRGQWAAIRDEALALYQGGDIGEAVGHTDIGFNSFFKYGWRRFYLTWYGQSLPSARARCPRTVALVEAIPTVRAALFALLPPGARLNPHRDPFAGSLRYHLGLATPNSDACRIVVDGLPYSWRDGEDIVFDETYIHWAENRTAEPRLILFCDLERPLRTPLVRALNRWVSATVIRAASTRNVAAEGIGPLNRLYAVLGREGPMRRLKRKSKGAYRLVQLLLAGAFLYWILFV
ncbi:MAG: aspartyl/asparaginyl beta-hydroxylase domain-containing protein [Betaproteobacteria bacterium]|nr:aspartyl/asparaginyl beta-hydroxylase domain-containing protein [Betaproteobacteria bacterium]